MVVKTLDAIKPFQIALPDGPHRFKTRGFAIDTATLAFTPRSEPAAFDGETKLVRREADGRVRWSVPAKGYHSVRPPDIATGTGFTVATFDGVVHGFDDATGKLAWTQTTAGDRLYAVGDTMYSVKCNEPTKDHWLIGSVLATGVEKFRVPLALGCDPYVTVTDRFIITTEDHPAETRIFDLAGKQLLQLPEQASGTSEQAFGSVLTAGTTTLLVTDKHVMALDDRAQVMWKRDPLRNTFVAGDQVIELPGGDLVIANFGMIDDSGVDLIRLRRDGSFVWRGCAAPLGVSHSKYQHIAYIEARGDDLFVASQGSFGSFLEKLSVATGERQLRCILAANDVATGCTKPPPRCGE